MWETSRNRLKNILLPEIVLTFHSLNKLFLWSQKVCKFSAFSLEFQKFFSITRTIFSHSKSEQFQISQSNRDLISRSYIRGQISRSKKLTRMSSGGRLRQGKTYTASAGKSPLSSFRSQVPVHHPEVKTASPDVSSSNKIRSPLTKFKKVEEPCWSPVNKKKKIVKITWQNSKKFTCK